MLAAAYITDNLCTKNGNSSFFKPKIRGVYMRAVTNQERVIMARVRYMEGQNTARFMHVKDILVYISRKSG